MVNTLNVTVTGVEEVAAHFGKLSEAARAKLYAKVYALALAVQAKAKAKVSGDVLQVRTGQLRANIFADTEDTGDAITGKIHVGANVKYAAIHEFGGIIHHPGGTAYLIDPKTGLARWISNKDPMSDKLPRTKPHDIPMPERSYLRSSLGEMKGEILKELSQSVQDAIKEG